MEEISYKFVVKDDLITLYPLWEKLLDSNPNHSFIHCFEWFSSYLDSHEKESRNCVFLVINYGEMPIAICPLQYVTKKKFGVSLKVWRIYWPGNMGLNDFIITKKHNGIGVLNILIQSLNENKSKIWNVLELQNVDEGFNISACLNEEKISRLISINHHSSKYIACQASYEESTANISGKFKRNMRSKLRKLKKLGSVSFGLVDAGDELDRAYQGFLKVESENWKGKAGTAIIQNVGKRKFYNNLKDNFGRKRQCLIHTLYLNNVAIAAQFLLLCGDTISLLKIGYDEKYASVGPGNILLDETIRKFSKNPHVDKVSFVTGAEWNDNWSPHVNKVYNHYIYNNNIIGLLAYSLKRIEHLGRTVKWKLTDFIWIEPFLN